METVENKYITVAYKLYSIENGEKDFEEEAPVEHPFQFISGLGMTLEPFEAQIKDLQIGDKFDFTIPASEAYGEYDDDHVNDLPKEIFMIEGEFDSDRVVEGAVIPLMTSEGQRINGSVVEVKEDVVVMDMENRCVTSVEGIIDEDVDQSIRNLTKIGSKGMNETDK